jgi:hypothetical protein
MMRRKQWTLVVALLLLLVAAQVAYWRFTAERLRDGYQAWVAAQVAQGWVVGSGPLSVGGWPRAAAMSVPTLSLRHAGPMMPGDVNIASAGVTLSVSLFNPTNLRMSLTGPMHVRAADLPDVIVAGTEVTANVALQQTGPRFITLHARGVRIEPAMGAWHVTVGLLDAQAQIADSRNVDDAQPASIFSISAEAIALPASIKSPLGVNISSLSIGGRLNGPLPASRDITGWAETWRDGGGSLEITHLAMGWGPLGLTSTATLALDDQLQPMGSGNARIVGYAETLDKLAAGGILTKSAATAAKAVLSLMARTSDADEPSSVDVPLTLQYRTLSMRQVPLVRLPEVDWSAH